jgi:hypothetical protein
MPLLFTAGYTGQVSRLFSSEIGDANRTPSPDLVCIGKVGRLGGKVDGPGRGNEQEELVGDG